MTLVPAGVVLTIEVSARFRSNRSYPDSVGQYNDPLSRSSPQVSFLSDADKNSDLREPLRSRRTGSSPLLRRHSTCHHDVGAGEQLDLHGLAAAADHAGGHSESGRPERPWARHGQEERSAGPQHHTGPGRGAAAQGRQTAVQLRQPHHVRHQQLAKEENDTERDLPVDLWQFPLLQGSRQRVEGKGREAPTVSVS